MNYLAKQGITVTKQSASDAARAFLETIEAAGYYPMLYTNADYLGRYFDADIASKYDIWLAQWPSRTPDLNSPPAAARGGIWQYANDGVVTGVKTRVDLNACYTDYPSIISEMEVNKVIYHTKEDIEKKAPWGVDTFNKLVDKKYLEGVAENDYSISNDMLRILTILDRAGAFGK